MKNHISAYLLAESHKKRTPYGKREAVCNQTLEIEEYDKKFIYLPCYAIILFCIFDGSYCALPPKKKTKHNNFVSKSIFPSFLSVLLSSQSFVSCEIPFKILNWPINAVAFITSFVVRIDKCQRNVTKKKKESELSQ